MYIYIRLQLQFKEQLSSLQWEAWSLIMNFQNHFLLQAIRNQLRLVNSYKSCSGTTF